MTADIREHEIEVKDGVIQLRFTNEEGTLHDLSASEFAEVLQGLVEFTADVTKNGLYGDAVAPKLRVRPPQEGSFVVEAVMQWAQDEALVVGLNVGIGAALTGAINAGVKLLHADTVTDYTDLKNGYVKINWRKGGVQEIPMETWKHLEKKTRQTKRALRKLMAPLSEDVDELEIRDSNTEKDTDEILKQPPAAVATKEDYKEAAKEPAEGDPTVETFQTEANITSVDFRPGKKWRVRTKEGSRSAEIEDRRFMRDVNSGTRIGKTDVFDVTIREEAKKKNGRTTKTWFVEEIILKRKGDDDDSPESPAFPENWEA